MKLRKLKSNYRDQYGFGRESLTIDGLELGWGMIFTSKPEKTIHLSYGLEFFSEFSQSSGSVRDDVPPIYEINHKTSYYGLAPLIKLNVRIFDNAFLTLSSRFRYGKVALVDKRTSTEQVIPNLETNYWLSIFEPINSFGLRISL